jgi:superfamily II DNA helicase RecQ
MAARGFNYPNKPILLVISPLVSLIKSHIHELNDHGISCVWLSGDDADENANINGEFSIVFASPESIVKNQKWREMLRGKIYQKNLFGIVTDEVHVIPKW